MVIPVGLGVEIVMIAGIHAHIGNHAPLSSKGKQGGSILVDLCSVLKLVHGFHLHGLLERGIVLHLHLRVELVFGSEVEGTGFIVNAEDGSNAEARLVAHQIYAQ